jgi:hypothetical protein
MASITQKIHSGGCSSIEFILALKKLKKLGVSNSGVNMRRTVLMVAALAFTAAPPHVEAQIRSARPCNTNQCLLKQIDALEAQVTDLKKQMDDLNANALKSGQTVNINSPDGCLSYGDLATMRTGPVWWSNPCQGGAWIIQPKSSP